MQIQSFSFLLYCALFHSSSSSQVSQYRLQFCWTLVISCLIVYCVFLRSRILFLSVSYNATKGFLWTGRRQFWQGNFDIHCKRSSRNRSFSPKSENFFKNCFSIKPPSAHVKSSFGSATCFLISQSPKLLLGIRKKFKSYNFFKIAFLFQNILLDKLNAVVTSVPRILRRKAGTWSLRIKNWSEQKFFKVTY